MTRSEFALAALVGMLTLFGGAAFAAETRQDLARAFAEPPRSAAPYVWWHMMNGNITKEGITADLESMARVGIAGAVAFDVDGHIRNGDVDFATDAWYDCLRHAAKEAKRLGLDLTVANCSGYSAAGGPWITPEKAQKRLVYREERVVTGPAELDADYRPFPGGESYQRPIAAFAVRVPDEARHELRSSARDGRALVYEFAGHEAVTRSLTYSGYYENGGWIGPAKIVVSVPEGTNWTPVAVFGHPFAREGFENREPSLFALSVPLTAEVFRVTIECPELPDKPRFRFGEVVVSPDSAVTDYGRKVLAERGWEILPTPEGTPALDPTRDVIALPTDRCRVKLPAGRWKVIRLGYVASNRTCNPATRKGRGLEVDKLDAAAVRFHLESHVGRMRDFGFSSVLVDSYEAGTQNWTAGFERRFERRAGYPMAPWYPALAGCVVKSAADTDRFLADFRHVLCDEFAENFAKTFADTLHGWGMTFSLEPYGSSPSDDLQYGYWADTPMSEFWAEVGNETDVTHPSFGVWLAERVSSGAHFWGRRVVGAEAFTAHPDDSGRWLKDAYGLKAVGDLNYAHGVNRMVYHRFAHQPWVDPARMPGMTMGPWGTHFERTITWWEQSTEWIRYQTRCQYMLQEGRFAADVLFYEGDARPNNAAARYENEDYSWDVCNCEALKALKVDGGVLVSPGGMRYRVLVRRPGRESDETEATLSALAKAGAKIIPDDWGHMRERFAEIGLAKDFDCADPQVTAIHRVYDGGVDAWFVARPREKGATVACGFNASGRLPEIWNPVDGTIAQAAEWRVEAGRTYVTIPFGPVDAFFVVFRSADGADAAKPEAPPAVKKVVLTGPWTLTIPVLPVSGMKPTGEKRTMSLAALADWTTLADDEFKYFSGTAAYEYGPIAAGTLDLGDVKNFAEVLVDGRRAALLWKPPFRCEVPAGRLTVKVTNLWPNRLIGDFRLCRRYAHEEAPWEDGYWQKPTLSDWPEWVKKGLPDPTGRRTMTTVLHWHDKHEPIPSGLLGPVVLERPLP